MFLRVSLLVGLLLGAALPAASQESPPRAASDPWPLPAAGACQPAGGLIGSVGAAQDASASLPFAPGDVFGVDRLETLRRFVPRFLWEHRERFFYEGMRLEVGPCFADYGAPAFFQEATTAHEGSARLLDNGGLEDHVAGLPFAPADIDPADPQAGLRWLWNVEERYQGAGFRGPFRMTDLLGRVGRAEPFTGEMFKLLFAHRADRAADGYRADGAAGKDFVAGGIFSAPFDARAHAWRQFRDLAHLTDPGRSDDLHAYLPQWRRVRRLNANRVEGLYMPSFSVGVQPNQQLAVGTGGGLGGGVTGAGGVGGVAGSITTKRSGWEGLELRPLLYRVEVQGLHDVLAPIASVTPSYPENPDRDFGPWGLSFASDVWDLRRALVLELTAKEQGGGDPLARQVLYVDLQTLQPLYIATFDSEGDPTNVGQYVGRWSESRPDYPRWPDDAERPVRVVDSVGAAFANLSESGSWRRESWTVVATPPPDREVKRLISVNELTKGR